MLFLGDHEDERHIENYLILQRAYDFDDQDRRLGMDSYYIEYNGPENAGYGVCERVVFDGRVLNFEFPSTTESEIESIVLTLGPKNYDEARLRSFLESILGDTLEA
ncbi:immunity protein 10 of polymorphic toxin system [Bradymonas sediminis]|nr:immunity protein 10 of polymorphic toxin system [Bradymonas sediminis]